MTTFQKSVLLWLGGGVAGALMSPRKPASGAAMGAIIVGGVGDVVLERADCRSERR